MADDPTRYLDISGVLALKPGATVDVDYTVVHAQSVAARHRELADNAVAAATDAAATEADRAKVEADRAAATVAGKRDVEATELGAEHMDAVLTPGSYVQSETAQATLDRGYPMARACVISVEATASRSIVTQRVRPYSSTAVPVSDEYVRTRYLGAWTAWALDGTLPKELGTEHFDTLTTPRAYSQSEDASATLERGYPVARAGVLEVHALASGNGVFQRYRNYPGTVPASEWTRASWAGQWTEWVEVGSVLKGVAAASMQRALTDSTTALSATQRTATRLDSTADTATQAHALAASAQQAAAEAVEAAEAAADLARQAATAAGSIAGVPEDGQAAAFIQQPESETARALDATITRTIPDRVLVPPVTMTATARDSRQQTMITPTLVDERVLIVDDAQRSVDGAQFFTAVEVGNRPGEWIDQWYGYVSGHGYGGGTAKGYIYLVTAPTPLGPWTWHERPVMGTGSVPYAESKVVGPRTLAPEVLWVGDELWLHYHGGKLTQPWTPDYDYANRRGAPSVLATSTDGVHFEEQGINLDIPEGVDNATVSRVSTSYRRIVRDGGLWHTVWQANTTSTNNETGEGNYAMGHAVSHDGRDWKMQPPLIVADPGDQGIFAPSVTKIDGGWLAACGYRGANGQEWRWYYAPELAPGAFQYLGPITLPPRADRSGSVLMPFFLTWDGHLWMAYGGRVNAGQTSAISISKVVLR